MSAKRSYGDRCGIARALDQIGDRWALLVVRELLLGPKRFTDLRTGLPNLSPDVLSQRLRDLEAAGLLTRTRVAPPVAASVYGLTERGQALEPVLLALGQWGSAAPFSPAQRELGPDSFILALKTLFSSDAAAFLAARFELRVNGQPFTASVDRGRFDVRRGTPEKADGVIESDTATLSKILWHGQSLEAGVRAGSVAITGGVSAARRFLSLFPGPQAAPA
jgi:DNA-binding HxlR family transcriptional regulator